MRTDNQHQQPTLAEVIQTVIDYNLIDLHVCLPAKILTYDPSTQTATVLPSLMMENENSSIPYPWIPIPNVPLIFPRALAGQAYIHMPIVPGDDVTLLICERSLDSWKETGILISPNDRRRHDITDAFAIPGGSGKPFAFNVDDAHAIEIANLLATLQIKPAGEIHFENAIASVTLSSAGKFTVDALLADIGTGAAHGVGLGDVIEARLSALESALATLTSVFGVVHTHAVISLGSPSGPPLPITTPFVPVPIPAASLTVKVST